MALDSICPVNVIDASIDQAVAEALVIPSAVVELDVLADDTQQMVLDERNQLPPAL